MAERALLYFCDRDSDTEEYIEIVIENFPLVPTGTTVRINDSGTFLFESEVGFYYVTEQGLEVDMGEVNSSVFQDLLEKCHKTHRHERFRYHVSITLAWVL